MRAAGELARRPVWRDALTAVAGGIALGGLVVLFRISSVGAWTTGALLDAAHWLGAAIGPVWIPMALVAGRVLWLAGRALASRRGMPGPRRPVRPELAQLAPLFAALGLCGTVWGLGHAFDALEHGEFLGQLPALLGGLGAAMTSTLAGLGLQIGTLLLATLNPVWSSAHVSAAGETFCVELDGQRLGADAAGMDALVEALEARRPEALRVRFDPALSAAQREGVRDRLWSSLDASLALREVVS